MLALETIDWFSGVAVSLIAVLLAVLAALIAVRVLPARDDDEERLEESRDEWRERAIVAEQRAGEAEQRARDAERRALEAARAVQDGAALLDLLETLRDENLRLTSELETFKRAGSNS